MSKILELSKTLRKSGLEHHFMNGGCYDFYRICRLIQPCDPVKKVTDGEVINHVYVRTEDGIYDVRGEQFPGEVERLSVEDEKVAMEFGVDKSVWRGEAIRKINYKTFVNGII